MESTAASAKRVSWRGQEWEAGQSVKCPHCPPAHQKKLVCWEHRYVYGPWLEGLRCAFGFRGPFRS